MDPELHPGRPKAGREVGVVAERLDLRLTTAAERCARQRLNGPVVARHLNFADDQQRTVAHRRHGRAPLMRFLRLAVEPAVLQRAARAALDHSSDDVWASLVGQHPWATLELEDLGI